MANTNNIQEQARQAVQKSTTIMQASKHTSTLSVVKSFIEKDDVKKRFQDILGKKAGQFLASIASLVSSNTFFDSTDPNTVMSAAIIAATLDLPINPNLGFAYIIPYNSKDGKKAQFQLGYKGYLQLALRSGQYLTINATEVYEGEVAGLNRLTGEITIDEAKKKSQKVVGYASYFKLLNGFEKTLYMTVEQLRDHGKKFSKSYSKENSLWHTDFHSMCMKTVLKLLLSKYGILSTDMQKAVEVDQGVIKEDQTVEYVDAITEEDLPTQADVDQLNAGIVNETSRNLAKGYLTMLEKANTVKKIDVITAAMKEAFDKGDLTEADRAIVATEINERIKSLEA